jgi:hypothetical protein
MKFELNALVIGLAAVQTINAHYTFDKLHVNGVVSGSWQYIRQHTQMITPLKQFISPGSDFRCNTGSFDSASKTQVASVAPGSRIAFQTWYGAHILHPGPWTVHMSKAPGDVRQYRGDGDWFKVHEEIICYNNNNSLDDSDWCSYDKEVFWFTIPQGTPPGEYLVRMEHIALHGASGAHTEFYFACAQVRVTGNGNGTPGPLVKIPGLYDSNDPALRFFIYGAKSYPYTRIGQHAVWTGGSNGVPTTTRSQQPTSGSGVALYGQCGGIGYTGSTICASGRCVKSNDYYSQCLP